MIFEKTFCYFLLPLHCPTNGEYYPQNRNDKVSPWIEAFVNVKEWVEEKKSIR
jgi:hypothetical protein